MDAAGKSILYDAPVSNSGARVRFLIYKKGIESEFDIRAPSTLGTGLKSSEYLQLNPQGKMPLLVTADGKMALPESEVIVQYILDCHRNSPSLVAATPELRARCALITRIHDLYIMPIQGCMYRQMPSAEQRSKDLGIIAYQLDAIEKTMGPLEEGPFIAGKEITTADGALFPTMVFLDCILPKEFGWTGLWSTRPRLAAWWEAISKDPEAKRVMDEVRGGLDAWVQADRWTSLGIREQIQANPGLKWSY